MKPLAAPVAAAVVTYRCGALRSLTGILSFAAQVVVSEWAPNADNDPLQPIDCSAYLLVAATTPIAGDNYAWTQ